MNLERGPTQIEVVWTGAGSAREPSRLKAFVCDFLRGLEFFDGCRVSVVSEAPGSFWGLSRMNTSNMPTCSTLGVEFFELTGALGIVRPYTLQLAGFELSGKRS